MKSEVLLIDLSGLFFPAWAANANGPVSIAFEATIGGVHRCISKVSPDALVAICLDSKQSWRKLMAPSYKAHREKLPEVFYEVQRQVKERLIADGRLLWEAPGFEADDVIATAALKAAEAGHDVTIASSDKDMARMLGPKVRQLKLSTFEFFTAEDVVAKWGIQPSQVTDFLALCCDTADGITGCPGVGPKKAAALLQQWGNIIALYAALNADPTITTPAIAKALDENYDAVKLAYQLAELRFDVPIKFEEIYEKREIKQLVATEEEPMEDDPFKRVPHNDPPMTGQAPGAAIPLPPIGEVLTQQTGRGPVPALGIHLQDKPVPAPEQSPDDLLASLLHKKGFAPVEYEKALEPRDGDALVRLAKNLFNSRIYSRYPTWESMAAVMQRGRAMGIGSIASLDCFDIIDGAKGLQSAPKAQLIIHLAQQDPNCEYLYNVETTETSSTWETKHKRNPKPTRYTYTREMAEKAGLLVIRDGKQPGNWHTRFDDMASKTAGSKLGRREYPGATLGLIPAEDMIGGSDDN